MADITSKSDLVSINDSLNTRFLQARQIEMIDEALCSVGEFGEVRLVIEKGRLRFLVTQKSFDTLKWQPGSLEDDPR